MDLLLDCNGQVFLLRSFWVWLCLVWLGSYLPQSQSANLQWQTQPVEQTVNEGNTANFSCSATYSKKIHGYDWELNNQSLPRDSRFTKKDDGRTLEISNVKFEDRGNYRCVAIRKGKSLGKSQNAALNVKGICSVIQATIKPSGKKFLTGTDLQLRCKCYIYPPGTYVWQKDGKEVVTNARVMISRNKLFINNATESDSGDYSCSATTQDGSVTKVAPSMLSVTVVVGRDPQFQVRPPKERIVTQGSQVVLPCKAIGSPTPEIKWYAGSARNPLQSSSKYTVHDNGTLVITNFNKQYEQKYKCTATSLAGEKTAESTLIIAYLNDVTLEQTKVYVLLNDPLEIVCNPPKAKPTASITWLKEGGGDLPKRFDTKGCCILRNNKTKLSDAGSYTCTAKNQAGNKSETVEIIVAVQPKIASKPRNQSLKEDEKAVLDCKAKTTPAPNISWYKGDKPVKVDQKRIFQFTNGTLVINKVMPDDLGWYECTADVASWSDSAEANVHVMAKVKLRGIHTNQVNADLHKPQKIRCDFEGHKPIKVTWKKEGVVDFDSKRVKQQVSMLIFEQIEKTDEGHYWCRGENAFSSAESYVNISVYVYPTFVLRPKNTTAFVDDHLWLHCNASGDPKPKISWSKEEQGGDKLDKERFFSLPNGTLHIKKVQLSDQGRYYCIAANHAEMKQSKFSLRVKPHPVVESIKSPASMGRTIGIAVGCAAAYIVLVVGLMIYCKGRRARQNKKEEVLPPECENLNVNGDIEQKDGEGNDMTMNPIYRSQPSYDKMEFPRHDLEALRSLGNGAYGRAFLARASGIRDGEKETMVVVKALVSNDDQVREDFSKEMEALCSLQHSNVVTLLGVCKEEEPFYMIFESLEKGDLKQFLLSCYDNGRSTLNSNQKLAICGQVATGMNYLSSQNFVHKDLAARNCMVGKDMQVKIGFLSFSYDLYNKEYYRFNNVQIPLRWMPPEAIFDDDFSEKSDVWSFGVLVWEIYTLGQLPYHDRSNEEVLKCVKDDLRLPKPDNCPDTVLEVLEKCWEGNPLARPTFAELMDDVAGISVDSHV
ncbi:Inactive tyrosine-protein kinase 7 [Stylophora pistillata]|uniref:Tyrosine-protein kinase receptor n=2 Tax=Stylophora pistillata TaxID=50429 RepID=A0A2B4RSI1_STYPI|nr:Inactive tyrosine-protein kinase 7 [Stylophora pistillata]